MKTVTVNLRHEEGCQGAGLFGILANIFSMFEMAMAMTGIVLKLSGSVFFGHPWFPEDWSNAMQGLSYNQPRDDKHKESSHAF